MGCEDSGGDAGVARSYAARAREYIDLFGTLSSTHPSDRALVGSWAATLTGRVLDAGCGPGHWTGFLARKGLDVRGIDLVPEFVDRARSQFPDCRFDLGGFDSLPDDTASLGGVLSWYSLIHHDPADIAVPLAEFARVIRPGGGLLVGFFEWPEVTPFDHAVTTAYRWPVAELCRELTAAGFDPVETHTRTGDGHRPHGAITARRRAAC